MTGQAEGLKVSGRGRCGRKDMGVEMTEVCQRTRSFVTNCLLGNRAPFGEDSWAFAQLQPNCFRKNFHFVAQGGHPETVRLVSNTWQGHTLNTS